MIDNSLESRTIELLRFPLIILVIAIHVMGLDFEQISAYGDWGKIYNIFFVGVTRVAVPCFFLISGYLFCIKNNNWGGYNKKIHKRLRSLVLPYFIWNAPWVFFCVKNSLSDNFGVSLLSGLGLFPFYSDYTFEPKVPWDSPMWYVRDLFCICLVSPVIVALVRRRVMGLIFIGLTSFLMCFELVPCVTGLSVSGILFFSIGAYWAMHGFEIRTISQNIWLLTGLFVGWVVALILDVQNTISDDYAAPWHGIQIMLGVLVLFGVAARLCSRGFKISKDITASVFFIYCFHYLVCLYITVPLRRYLSPEGFSLLLYFALSVIFTLVVSLATYYLLKRYAPKPLSFITSGR